YRIAIRSQLGQEGILKISKGRLNRILDREVAGLGQSDHVRRALVVERHTSPKVPGGFAPQIRRVKQLGAPVGNFRDEDIFPSRNPLLISAAGARKRA